MSIFIPSTSLVAGVPYLIMAKLTRHPSFQALKADTPPARVSAVAREQAHTAFEEFVRLVQRARKAPATDER